jgi:hypothetical protein
MILETSDSSYTKYTREWGDINTNGALKVRGSWAEPYIKMADVTKVICFIKYYLVRSRKLFWMWGTKFKDVTACVCKWKNVASL